MRTLLAGGAVLTLLPSPLWCMAESKPAQHYSLDEIARDIAGSTRLDESYVQHILAEATFKPDVIERILSPYEAKPYVEYRPLFVNPRMRKMGESFLQSHADIFSEAERNYQVERTLIAAILGLESHYGTHRGTDRVLDALYTLASGYPRRTKFFRRELGEFLLLCQEEHLSPAAVLGSYAGAFGVTQFIPSSYRAFAVDADADGKRDVWNSPSDIISSVANYFHLHGWKMGRPVAQWLPTSTQTTGMDDWELKKWVSFAELKSRLPHPAPPWKDEDRVSLIEMTTEHGRQLALVHYNFYVITRWNRSYNYAMAATELAAMLGCPTCAVS